MLHTKVPKSNAPRDWIAALLGFFGVFLGMLYVVRPHWALAYLMLAVSSSLISFAYPVLGHLGITRVLQYGIPLICAMHCVYLSKNYLPTQGRPWYSRWYGLTGIIASLILITGLVRGFLVEPYRMPSASMNPSIPTGSNIIVRKIGYGHYGFYGLPLLSSGIVAPLQRGDVIAFEYPLNRRQIFLKRLIGLPGDHVSYVNKQLSINGIPIQSKPLPSQDNGPLSVVTLHAEKLNDIEYTVRYEKNKPPMPPLDMIDLSEKECQYNSIGLHCRILPKHFFVLGDNRDESADSRIWGFVPEDHIIGKVIKVIPIQ